MQIQIKIQIQILNTGNYHITNSTLWMGYIWTPWDATLTNRISNANINKQIHNTGNYHITKNRLWMVSIWTVINITITSNVVSVEN